jgi:hypothetical protein
MVGIENVLQRLNWERKGIRKFPKSLTVYQWLGSNGKPES